MDFRDIKRIVELMNQHGLSVFKLEQDQTKLELKKGSDLDIKAIQKLMSAIPSASYPSAPVALASPEAITEIDSKSAAVRTDLKEIVAPMVGTFYSAASPDAAAFVKVGSKVTADTTVCIVEAMKVMNEIKAEISGEIVEVLVENGTAVQYGEPLYRVKTT